MQRPRLRPGISEQGFLPELGTGPRCSTAMGSKTLAADTSKIIVTIRKEKVAALTTVEAIYERKLKLGIENILQKMNIYIWRGRF